MPKTKVFLDTDIGSDPDDCFCLTYLLNQPECEIVGISTVGPYATKRAKLAAMLCRHFGQPDVRIAAGADHPILSNPYWLDHHLNQEPVLETFPVETEYARGEALQLMRKVIRGNPGEVILLAVGPFSNAALLAAADPETAGMVKELVIMGGRYDNTPEAPRGECNAMLDGAATAKIMNFHWPAMRAAGIDCTGGLGVPGDVVKEKFDNPRLQPLYTCACHGLRGGTAYPGLGVHDPLTAALLFKPDLCDYRRGRISVKLYDNDPKDSVPFGDDKAIGITFFEPDEDGPHVIAVNARKEQVHEHLFGVVCGE